MDKRFKIVKGDITLFDTDAIVNAANNELMGGGGVDGAIHRAAGSNLLKECRSIGFCATGSAVVTSGYNLKARHVIHTVGPIYDGTNVPEKKRLLQSCYTESLKKAVETGAKTVAFPSISTGVYRFPLETATVAAIEAINDFLSTNDSIEQVYMVCWDDNTLNKYMSAYERLSTEKG